MGSRLITREKAVLVVIDVQEKLFSVMSEKEKILENIIRLTKFAQIMGIPVVLTEQYPKGLGATVKEIKSLIPDIHPIEKMEFNCFRSEEFRKCLNELEARTLIVAGIEAHICVSQTVLEGLDSHKICVISDAISSRTRENREIGLERMRGSGAIISSTEMLMYELLERAGTREFKEALKLVK